MISGQSFLLPAQRAAFVSLLMLPVSALCEPPELEIDCYSPPPEFTSVEAYRFESTPPEPLDMEQMAELESFVRRLQGLWNGVYIETFCQGSEDNPERITTRYTGNLNGRFDPTYPTSLKLSGRMDSRDNSKPLAFRLYLDKDKQALYFMYDSPGNQVTLSRFEDDHLDFSRKFIGRSAGGGVIRQELHVTVAFENGDVLITQMNYINGMFSGSNQLELQ